MARKKQVLSDQFRMFHRYLGFFLAGIMAVYAISGIVLTFRNTDYMKSEVQVTRTLEPGSQQVFPQGQCLQGAIEEKQEQKAR